MTPDDDRNARLEDLEEQASMDEAATQAEAHEERRGAERKQGDIERETRRHQLDEG